MPFLLLALACDATAVGLAPPCTLAAPVPEVETAAPGDRLKIAAHPLGEAFDTAVYIGATRAELLGVQRVDCEAWDSCLTENGCGECADCDACGTAARSCVETARVVVPELPDGEYAVVIYTQYGVTAAGTLQIAAD